MQSIRHLVMSAIMSYFISTSKGLKLSFLFLYGLWLWESLESVCSWATLTFTPAENENLLVTEEKLNWPENF